ncbi:MAG TPA: MFS transporter [Elusimicrobiota bacterium]|nr:MFS transporter [Elusimicrobiota bacterium]
MFSLAVFQDADAAKIFSGQAISQICDKMMTVGLVWVIVSLGSLRLVPWFLAAGALPHLLFSRPAAKWINKMGPLKTVVSTDAARGAVYLAAWAAWAAWPKMSVLFYATILANCASALFNPAILSLPTFLPRSKSGLLSQLTAMLDSCFSLGNVLGPVAAALLYPWIGLGGLFLANALSYFFAAGLESRIKSAQRTKNDLPSPLPSPEGRGDDKNSLAHEAGEGRGEGDRLIRFLLAAFFLMNLAFTPILAFLPLFAKYRFAGGIGILSAMETSLGLGMAGGSLVLSLTRLDGKAGPRLIASLFSVSLMYLLFAFNRSPYLACAALFLLGSALSVLNVTILTLFQTRPREEEVPAIMGWVNLISVGAIPLSMALMGGLVESANLGTLALACAATLLALSGMTALYPGVRRA